MQLFSDKSLHFPIELESVHRARLPLAVAHFAFPRICSAINLLHFRATLHLRTTPISPSSTTHTTLSDMSSDYDYSDEDDYNYDDVDMDEEGNGEHSYHMC